MIKILRKNMFLFIFLFFYSKKKWFGKSILFLTLQKQFSHWKQLFLLFLYLFLYLFLFDTLCFASTARIGEQPSWPSLPPLPNLPPWQIWLGVLRRPVADYLTQHSSPQNQDIYCHIAGSRCYKTCLRGQTTTASRPSWCWLRCSGFHPIGSLSLRGHSAGQFRFRTVT